MREQYFNRLAIRLMPINLMKIDHNNIISTNLRALRIRQVVHQQSLQLLDLFTNRTF